MEETEFVLKTPKTVDKLSILDICTELGDIDCACHEYDDYYSFIISFNTQFMVMKTFQLGMKIAQKCIVQNIDITEFKFY